MGQNRLEMINREYLTHVCWSHDAPDLVHRDQIRAQPSMRTKDFVIDDGRKRHAVEDIGEYFPQL